MPTEYTAALCEGEQSFGDFVRHAMTGMVFNLPAGSAEYSRNELARLSDEFAGIQTWDDDRIEEEYLKARQEWNARNEQKLATSLKVLGRLHTMRLKVSAWEPPTPDHWSFKKFMLDVLDRTIDAEQPYTPDWPPWQDSKKWFYAEWEKLKKDIERHQEQIKRVTEENAWRENWRQAILKSLEVDSGSV